MATTFNMLRANDLIWSFVVNNYLLGNDPFPFDLLYWNADSTRMPARMHSFYLRNMYQENLLASRAASAWPATPIDLGRVKMPAYFLSTREDHIAPWRGHLSRHAAAAAARTASCWRPPATSPAWSTRRRAASTATGSTPDLPDEPEDWFAGATEMAGSWWPDWQRWITALDKRQVKARSPGDGKLKPIEDAPGSYVKVLLT